MIKAGAQFSITTARNPCVDAAINSIDDQVCAPVHHPAWSPTRTPAN
jgi:hypothetical protein